MSVPMVDSMLDAAKRPLHDLRISVMDRCNFRCPYCMPRATFHENYGFLRAEERLDPAEILRLARVFAALGVRKLRVTGGEPLLLPQLPALVAELCVIPGIADVALTTNGSLLAKHAQALKAAGLQRVTVSLDSSVTQPFCMSCSRARLSSDGVLYTCLFATQGTSLRSALRNGASDAELAEIIAAVWQQRSDRYSEQRTAPKRALPLQPKVEMHYIGG